MTVPARPVRRTAGREFFRGVGMLARGFGTWRTDPRRMLLGALPALIVASVYTVGIVVLLLNLDRITEALTVFAADWDELWRGLLRGAIALAFVIAAGFLWVWTYTSITLIIGTPFYERIWRAVEERLGGIPEEPQTGFWRLVGRGIVDTLALLVPTVLLGILIFALGFVPLLGGVLAFVLGAFVGGWFLAIETTALPFDARGFRLRDRRRALRGRRALVLGYGVATYLVFLVPGLTVFAMPAAVAGATHLSREVLQPTPA